MGKKLLLDAIDLVESKCPKDDPRGEGDQNLEEERATWTANSHLHRKKYGVDFRPDVDPTWDT